MVRNMIGIVLCSKYSYIHPIFYSILFYTPPYTYTYTAYTCPYTYNPYLIHFCLSTPTRGLYLHLNPSLFLEYALKY